MARRTRSVPKSQRQYVLTSRALDLVRELGAAQIAKMPGFVEPCLPELWERSPDSEHWIHEIKHDGYRLQIHLDDAGMKAFTRRGNDWSHRFKPILASVGLLNTKSAIIDGEVVVETETGHSDFGGLEEDLGAGRTDRLVFHAFDLLYLDAHDLRAVPLIHRKQVLCELLAERKGDRLRYVEHLEARGPDVFRNACKAGA